MEKKRPVGIIECIHEGCVKAKLLNFESLNRLYAYPRMEAGLKIYIASCYVLIPNAKKIREMFSEFIMKNELYKNIDLNSIQCFGNAIGLNITVYSITNTEEEKNKLSLFYALHRIIPRSSELKIKLVDVYKYYPTSENVEKVFFEIKNLRFSIFKKMIGRLKRLEVYKIKSPKDLTEFRQDRRSLYEQQDDPVNYIRRWQLLEKVQGGKELSSDEKEVLEFYESFLAGKLDTLIREKRITVEEVDRTKKAIKKIKGHKLSIDSLPVDLNKIPSWIMLLSQNEIPPELKKYVIQAEDLFEYYVHKLFLHLLGLDCKLWGQKETRFREFSDGYFLIPRENIVCLFDTKASKKGYKKNEILKFANYVKKHERNLFALKMSKIKYFIVISSKFHVDFKGQASGFYAKAGVKLVFCRAEDIVNFTIELRKISEQKTFLESVDWEEGLLSKADPCLTKEIFDKELEKLKESLKLY